MSAGVREGDVLAAGGAALFLTAPTRSAAEGAATGRSTTTTLWLRPNGFAVSGEF